MSRDYFHEAQRRSADGDHLYRERRPASRAPAGAPSSAELVANAAGSIFGGDPWEALDEIELHDPRIPALRDPLGVIGDPYAEWLTSRCLAKRPGTPEIVCLLNRGHEYPHRSNPIPALEWPQ